MLLSGCAAGTSAPPKAAAPPAASKPADNGIKALPAAAILKRAQQALAAAKSYHHLTTDDATLKILVVDGLRLAQPDEATLTATFGARQGRELTRKLAGSWIKPDARSFRRLSERFDVAELIEPAGSPRAAPRSATSAR